MKKETKILRAISLLKEEGYTIIPPTVVDVPSVTKKDYMDNFNEVVGNDILRGALLLWVQYKKEKGQTYKPIGLRQCVKRLRELSNDNPGEAMTIVESSIANNYAGLFKPRSTNETTRYGKPTKQEAIKRIIENSQNRSEESGAMDDEVFKPY